MERSLGRLGPVNLRTFLADAWGQLSRREYAPPGAKTPTGRLLWHDPPPLIDPHHKLMVIFSPKAACSNVVVWFLHHLGHADVARDYHVSPHRYRIEVYYHSALYHRAYRHNLRRYHVVRVVRDPYDRAVSAFRHLLHHAHGRFARNVGMSRILRDGLSFSQYLDFLERLDLRTCDVHFRLQRHPIEDVVSIDDLINVSSDDLYARLNAVEDKLGLKRTNLATSRWVTRIDRRNRKEGETEISDLYRTPLSRDQALNGPWPSAKDFLNEDARRRLSRLYAVDIESYGRPV